MKKILSVLLATTLATGMAATAFAASPDEATGMVQNLSMGYSQSVGSESVDLDTIRPNDEHEEYIYLYEDMFEWDDGRTGSHTLLTNNQIRKSNLKVYTSFAAGSKAIEEVTLDRQKSRIEIIFVDEYVSTKELDFEFTVYLSVDGKRQRDYEMTFSGTLENEIIDVFEDYDYVDLADGSVAEAQEFVKNIEVDLGNGVSVFTKFFKDKSYYGTATRDSDDADEIVFSQYPDVDNVVTLKTVGLNSTGDIVKLDTDYSEYYVYDKDMNYLGRSSEMLPFSSKYYLANKLLDVETEEEVDEANAPEETEEEDDDEYDAGAESGGDGEYEVNANANPGTGR